MLNKTKKVKIKQGIVHVGLHGITDLDEALQHNTKCGAGIDPIKGIVVLPNYNSTSGDIDGYHAVYIVDGELRNDPVELVRGDVQGFICNPLVSATGVVISGCPTGDVLSDADPIQLTATVQPTGASQAGAWTSSVVGVATVSSSGLVTIVGDGTTVITFTSTDGGFTTTCSITVVTV